MKDPGWLCMIDRRKRVIIAGVALAVIGTVVPIASTVWISTNIAYEKERLSLKRYAKRTIARADSTLQEAHSVLLAMQSARLEPCSAEHIAMMRDITVQSISIEEIGYFERDMLKCTSWGKTTDIYPKAPTDFTTPEGLEVALLIKPYSSFRERLNAVQLDSYNVLIMPSRFIDIVTDKPISINLSTPDGVVLGKYYADGARKSAKNNSPDRNHLFATAEGAGLVAVVSELKTAVNARIVSELSILLPLGTFLAFVIVCAIYWLSKRRLSFNAELSRAVKNREFVLQYQPIVNLESGVCIGAEALVRWVRPDGTIVPPDIFVPLAEDSGLILPITDQVIELIIKELGRDLQGDRSIHIAVNVCADDIRTGRVIDFLDRALIGTNIMKEQIWLEATERGFVNINAARQTLERARERGHSVAIDDFGTGYSSLQYLQSLPLDALKIDKSFVDTVGVKAVTSSVIPHIIEMAKDLQLVTVAEGVETREQLDYLRARGVNYGQGWFFSKALSASEFAIFHKESRSRCTSQAIELLELSNLAT